MMRLTRPASEVAGYLHFGCWVEDITYNSSEDAGYHFNGITGALLSGGAPTNDYKIGGMYYYEYEQQDTDVYSQITFHDKLAMQSWTQDFEGGGF